MSAGLHPDRGPLGIRHAARLNDQGETLPAETQLSSAILHQSVRRAIQRCAVLDTGGFLAAFGQEVANDADYIVEGAYIANHCARSGAAEPVKRESCFDVGWLISEEPQDLTVTQHSAFRDTFSLNSRYAQTMRSNIYGGVVRADLHRIGVDDHWYLHSPAKDRLAILETDQRRRQVALIQAIVNFLASPTGARVAGWAPHCFLVEGAILLTSVRTAPFVSPIKVDLSGGDNSKPVSANEHYRPSLKALENNADTWVWEFNDVSGLLEAGRNAVAKLGGGANNGANQPPSANA